MNTELTPYIYRLREMLLNDDKLDVRKQCLPLVEAIGASQEVATVVCNIASRHLKEKKSRRNDWYILIEGGIILAQTNSYLLVFRTPLSFGSGEGEYIDFPSDRRIFLNCSAAPVSFPSYKVPDICFGEVFRKDIRLKPVAEVVVGTNAAYLFDDPTLAIGKRASQLACNLSLYDLRTPKIERWLFDSESLTSCFSSIGDQELSSLRATIDLLGRMGSVAAVDKTYIDTLGHFISHPFHVIRWAAIQAICSIDFDAGKPLLIQATNDRHPDVSMSARQVVIQESLV